MSRCEEDGTEEERTEDDEPVPDLSAPCDTPPGDIHADHDALLMLHYEVLRSASYWSEVAG